MVGESLESIGVLWAEILDMIAGAGAGGAGAGGAVVAHVNNRGTL